MTFWDRFVIWLYVTLGDTLPVGRDVMRRLFAYAFDLGRLTPATVNDLSLLLILAADPPGASGADLRAAAEQEALRRNVWRRPQRIWQVFQAIRLPEAGDVLEIGRPQPLLRGQVAGVLLTSPLRYNLRKFLGRLYLRDPEQEVYRATRFIVQATGLYYRTPQGIMELPCRLYRHVLTSLRPADEPIPSTLPPGPPDWLAALDADERRFIQQCLLLLPESDRQRLYLHFYARLTVEQIAAILQTVNVEWTADLVALWLENSWQTVL